MECDMERSVFFERDLGPMDRPDPSERRLEVKVMWGPVALQVCEFGAQEVVTVGAGSGASLPLPGDPFHGELFELASPGGPDGFLIHLSAGMRLDVRREDREVEPVEPPGPGQVRNHALRLGQRARVMVGQLAFVFQYVQDARPVRSRAAERADLRMPKYWLMVFIVALGAWFTIETTPTSQAVASDRVYPARLVQLIMPSEPEEENQFPEILKKPEAKPARKKIDRWRAVTDRPARHRGDIPHRRRPKDDQKIAENSGILALLKEKGGTGGPGGTIFGGTQAISLDEKLEGIQKTGMGPSGGFADMGTRKGSTGGYGPGIGIGGMGNDSWGKPEGFGYDEIGEIGVPGKRGPSRVTFDRRRSRIIGGLTQKVVGACLRRHVSRFKFCYEKELGRSPNLWGKVLTQFTIEADGRVRAVNVLNNTMDNANIEHCLQRAICLIHFPRPRGGGEVIVTYPFLFRSAGD